jgi:NitT/TauT family transport system substrate-binding protein
VETEGQGYVAWYSKDVMPYKHGHVECIIIAKDKVIAEKNSALREVIYYIHRAGRDIELARRRGGEAMEEIVRMVRKHIPAHTREAIIQSLRPDLNAINFSNLNVDDNAKGSFREIMNLAYEAGFIHKRIDINQLADPQFSTEITKLPLEPVPAASGDYLPLPHHLRAVASGRSSPARPASSGS